MAFLIAAKARYDRAAFGGVSHYAVDVSTRAMCSKLFFNSLLESLSDFVATINCGLLHCAQATREAANPVLWVRGANLRCELIAQAGCAWQGSLWPSRPKSILCFRYFEHTQTPEGRRTKNARYQKRSSTTAFARGRRRSRQTANCASRELIRLDLPTLDRPRNAISGLRIRPIVLLEGALDELSLVTFIRLAIEA
jgi:hypothetical protein